MSFATAGWAPIWRRVNSVTPGSLLPQWLPVYLLTFVCAVVLCLSPELGSAGLRLLSGPFVSMEALQHARGLFLYPLAIAIYLLRDVLVVLFFNFGPGGRRGDATAFIILFLAYFPLTGILVSLEMVSLIPLLAPYPLAPPLISFAAGLAECAALGLAGLSPAGAGGPLRPRPRLRPAAGGPQGDPRWPATTMISSSSAPARAASGRRASPRAMAPGSPSPRNIASAGPASSAAACPRSCWSMPPMCARRSRMPRAMAGRSPRPVSTGRA